MTSKDRRPGDVRHTTTSVGAMEIEVPYTILSRVGFDPGRQPCRGLDTAATKDDAEELSGSDIDDLGGLW